MSAEEEESEITSGVDPMVTEESQSGAWGAEGRTIGFWDTARAKAGSTLRVGGERTRAINRKSSGRRVQPRR